MGAISSKNGNASASRNYSSYDHDGYPKEQQQSYYAHDQQQPLQRTYSTIAANYKSLDEVTAAPEEIDSSNLIIGIDFTKSNEWTGRSSFNRRSLHHIGEEMNPYEQAISIIGKTMSNFDEDNLIPCFGFGDASTHDQDVFNFYPDGRPCNGFEEVLSRYREIVHHLRPSGPTSFAPMIEMATTIVEETGGQYHVLLIIADGQTRIPDAEPGRFSLQERRTINAIVRASEYPLSIVLVGVGDGPWDMMKDFDDHIPKRAFHNFQFVNLTEVMLKNTDQMRKETEFALAALMEIPMQYRATLELGILGRRTGRSPGRIALPTPNIGTYRRTSSFGRSPKATSPPNPLLDENEVCAVCHISRKNMAFGCGDRTCGGCGPTLSRCPICKREIEIRIDLLGS